MTHVLRFLVAGIAGRLCGRLFACAAILSLLTACAADQAKERPKPKRIDRSQSKLDVRIDGLSNDRLRYYYLGWSPSYSYEGYAVSYHNRSNGQYLRALLNILATDEYYWSGSSDVSVEKIKRLRYFKEKAVNITFKTKGMNAGYDSSAAGPNYLLFTADSTRCAAVKRFSSLGMHGGTEIPRTYTALYCAPMGDTISREQAAEIARNGLIYIKKPTGGKPK